jgi:hypothetical protein
MAPQTKILELPEVEVKEWPGGQVILCTELWEKRPVVLFIVRRPGCHLCRAEAHLLHSQKNKFDLMNVHLVAVVKENVGKELVEFQQLVWPHADIVVDSSKAFSKTVFTNGNPKHSLCRLLGNLLVPCSKGGKAIRTNSALAWQLGLPGNLRGEGLFKGGLLVAHRGGMIEYAFAEEELGERAPIEDVLAAARAVSEMPEPSESIPEPQEEPSILSEIEIVMKRKDKPSLLSCLHFI